MKKIMVVAIGLLMGSQAVADNYNGKRHDDRRGYHGNTGYNNYYQYHNRNYYNNNRYDHNRYNHNRYNYYSSRGQWRHTNHNGQLAWWFVVGSMFYLSEQAYLNDQRNYNTVIVNPPTIYNPPVYVESPRYTTHNDRNNYGWYCETTGRFSEGSYDSCPTPWITRQY